MSVENLNTADMFPDTIYLCRFDALNSVAVCRLRVPIHVYASSIHRILSHTHGHTMSGHNPPGRSPLGHNPPPLPIRHDRTSIVGRGEL